MGCGNELNESCPKECTGEYCTCSCHQPVKSIYYGVPLHRKGKPIFPFVKDGLITEIGNVPCDNCGHVQYIGWSVRKDLWNKVIREKNRAVNDYLCLDCFAMFCVNDNIELRKNDLLYLSINNCIIIGE